jgi:hypothetical protein
MAIVNPFLESMSSNSDDELFEIILKQERNESPLFYDAAVLAAHSRELITDYQAKGLMEGDVSVLDYNPDAIDNIPDDYRVERKRPEASFNFNSHKILFGLGTIALGVLLIYLTSIDFFYTKFSKYVGGAIMIVAGTALTIVGIMEKWSSRH